MFRTDTPFIISSLHITVYIAVCTYHANCDWLISLISWNSVQYKMLYAVSPCCWCCGTAYSTLLWITLCSVYKLICHIYILSEIKNNLLFEFFQPSSWSIILSMHCEYLQSVRTNKCTYYINTVERRLIERQSSETSNIRTNIFFVLRSNNEKSAITSRNKVLCHFY